MISNAEKKLEEAFKNRDVGNLLSPFIDCVQEVANKLSVTFPVNKVIAPAIITAMKMFIASTDHNFPGAEALGSSFYDIIKEHITEIKIDLGEMKNE